MVAVEYSGEGDHELSGQGDAHPLEDVSRTTYDGKTVILFTNTF